MLWALGQTYYIRNSGKGQHSDLKSSPGDNETCSSFRANALYLAHKSPWDLDKMQELGPEVFMSNKLTDYANTAGQRTSL